MFGSVAIGASPRVVGVITSPAAFLSLAPFPCDIVEVRLDKIGRQPGWLQQCEKIEASGKPVLLTIRSSGEGGAWTDADEARRPLLQNALAALAAVDIELESKIASDVANLARKLGKGCVLSYHDFQKTPSANALQAILARAEKLGGVTKIAAMIHSDDDADRLRALLKAPRRQPLCVIGMGDNWARLRVELARLGSCLTYGYLDSSAAPGQIAAADLLQALRA